MKQVIGYIVALLGIVALAASFVTVRKALAFIPAGITNTTLMITGIILIAIGVLLLFRKGGSKQVSEVPIYHGKNIVGYRRLGK